MGGMDLAYSYRVHGQEAQRYVRSGNEKKEKELNRLTRLIANVKGVRGVEVLTVVSPSEKKAERTVARRLTRTVSGRFPSEKVEVTFFGGAAVITGRVGSLATRCAVHDLVADDDAVEAVVDKIEVESRG